MAKKWCLIGFPDDEGVRNVGGRIGAAKGPGMFREMWAKINGRDDVNSLMNDIGDISARLESLEEKHLEAVELVKEQQPKHQFSVAVGGGHDYIYCLLKGIAQAYPDKTIGCINIDPHFDMREPVEKISSGSPFYLALEEGVIKGEHLVEFGIQPHSNAPALWKFAQQHHVDVVLMEECKAGASRELFKEKLFGLATACDLVVVSLDMDVLEAPYAPGVSAPAAEGFTPSEIREFLRLCAEEEKVVSLGIFELNPNFDIDNRTAKLAAVFAWYFTDYRLFAS